MTDTITGVLKRVRQGGVLRDPARSFRRGPRDVAVSSRLIEQYDLQEGATVTGPVKKDRHEPQLVAVESICGLPPDQFQERTHYTDLVAVDPTERFSLGVTGNVSMRVVDLIAPVGKGTRSLIVSPPKAGKTILLEQIANAVHTDDPDCRIIILLINERPEEVTNFRRNVPGEVLSSSSDQTVEEHIELAELTLAHVRTELECARDVVVLVDSLTRMGRAFNLKGSGTGRTMTGGLEAGALEIPRRFFGLARKIEKGGSVTIIATALVDTGSKMDQLIFEEFKGTGNSEIILDRQLAEQRIFPAIDIPASGTRKEERLYPPDDIARISKLRRALVGRNPRDAMTTLLRMLEKFPTNQEFLQTIPLTS